jgi:hypothetical protein
MLWMFSETGLHMLLLLLLQGQYRKAHELKVAADAMYHEELASTHAAWDSEVALRKTRLLSKQQGEQPGCLIVFILSCEQL